MTTVALTRPALRPALRALAIASCLPYLALKIAWISGSRLGIPEHSLLLEHRAFMALANGGTVLMDGCVIVLALLLTRPWGLRVKAWLLALPMWLATGLLAPVMTGYPLQLLVRALSGTAGRPSDPASAPYLDEWVFGVVYTGFIIQGLTLGTLFALYARDRWGHLWRGRTGELPQGTVRPATRTAAVAVAVLSLLPAGMHALWSTGSATGLSPSMADGRTSDQYVVEALFAAFAVVGAAGVLMLAFGLGRSLPLRVPLALAWLGSGATACWGGWLWLSALMVTDGTPEEPTTMMHLTYSVQMIIGMLVVTMGTYFFAERSRHPDPTT
uniref:LigA protein n=1 Tax=Streptomyces sp. NBC_00003 TaxID=2903608 RepID=A0AAU2VB87_9ACTN